MEPVLTDLTNVIDAALQDRAEELDAFVRARVRRDLVDDVRQRAALRAIEGAASLDDPDRVVPWLYTIHRRLIIDTYRAEARQDAHVDASTPLPDVVEPTLDESCACSVSQAQRLRPSYATVLRLVDSDGLSIAEAARRLETSINNATVRLHRARKALREAMFEHCGVRDVRDCASCRCIEDACCPA